MEEKKNNQTEEDGPIIEWDRSWPSRILLVIFVFSLLASVSYSYYRFFIKKDYEIVADLDCDPYEERCFVHVCNPDPLVDGECSGNPEEDTWFTKKIHRIAYNIPNCNPKDEGCLALECAASEDGCYYELCGEANVPEGDSCNDPVQYAKDNPLEEDPECEEGDEECQAGEAEEDGDQAGEADKEDPQEE